MGARRIAALAWLAGTVACTRVNPAFGDGDGDGDEPGPQSGTAEGSSTRGPGEDETGVDSASGGMEGPAPVTTGGASEDGGSSDTTGEPPPMPPPQVGPFGEPALVEVSLPGHQDDDPTLTGDMLEIYFSSTRPGGLDGFEADIWVAHRDSLGSPWSEPEPVVALSSIFRDNTPEIHVEGLTMLLSSNRDDPNQPDVYVSTRRDRSEPWSMPVRVEGLSTMDRDVCPFLTDDQAHVYSCLGPDFDQGIARFDLEGKLWSGPVPIDELNGANVDCAAWVDSTMQAIAFISNRGRPAMGIDLWLATRASPEEPFGEATTRPFTVINTEAFEDDPWISPDGGTLFFASDREGDFDLYVAYREE